MRPIMFSLAVALAVPPAAADTALAPVIDLGTIPAHCRPLASAPSNATTRGPLLDAYISVASCEVLVRTHALALATTPQSRDALDHAVRPSLELLGYVIAHGDLAHQIAAQRAKADTYAGMVVLLATTVSSRSLPLTNAMTIDEYVQRFRYADALTRTWRVRADAANREASRLATRTEPLERALPQLTRG